MVKLNYMLVKIFKINKYKNELDLYISYIIYQQISSYPFMRKDNTEAIPIYGSNIWIR
jgi:hypothetical protein